MRHLKLYFTVSILAVLLSAWAVNSAKSAGNSDQGTAIEAGQAAAPAATYGEATSGSTEGMPSSDEMNSRLNGVNLSPPFVNDPASSVPAAGPMPRTESSTGGSIVPLPAPTEINGSPDLLGNLSQRIIDAAVKLISDWFHSILSSILTS